ncbi:hypothetical protein PUNSTDRAFT_108564 [Punctularia strigosozonata HHB-11173 SS5]|uniref:SH3 domain-containing protein n=1 Tax=Punctularia strigosozonata (strain HHB-11173) TaxID=741275 RepID=R7S2R3_PUNST|nr:uncharacterized protein PUNSTDRAFT_108564 [Punctularia strigosozonata HHB-11173 SS5]EIN04082.1 hypothetical protein PUNSTDRAFT_108564 [Punctularia strigosozonata HHB-11173 SS5]
MLGDSFSTNSSPPCFADTIVESPQAESPSRDPSTRLSPVDSIANRRLGVAISYAIAIFPNTAENEGELDVAVGGAFVVFPQSSSWWIAQRDATGKGIFDGGDAKQGWVPAGCFLTLSVPVATAVAEARERRSPGRSGRSSSSLARTGLTNDPILPMRIESKCLPGVILEDYKKREAHELEVARDTAVLIYKRYGHWSYAVKLVSGERGWLPSWYIGKVTVEGQRNGDASLTLPLTPRIQGGDDEDGYWDVIDWQMPVVPSTPLFVESSVAPIVGSTRSAASSRIIVTGKENLKAEVTRTARVAKRAVLVPSAKSTRKARREFSITSAQVLLSA